MNLKINVYSELNQIIENEQYFAIKTNNVIKYIDLTDNKMNIDMDNDIIKRENNDYIFILNFKNNLINIIMKHPEKEFIKEIKTIKLEKRHNSYLVRYKLIDENIINKYYIKY